MPSMEHFVADASELDWLSGALSGVQISYGRFVDTVRTAGNTVTRLHFRRWDHTEN